MVEGLDMALDDIIKKKKQKAKANKADFGALGSGSGIGSDGGVGGGGAGRGYGPRPSRRFSKRGSSRMMPYTTPATVSSKFSFSMCCIFFFFLGVFFHILCIYSIRGFICEKWKWLEE